MRRARWAADELAMALGCIPGLVLIASEHDGVHRSDAVLRIEGRVEAGRAILALVRSVSGTVLGTVREDFRRRAGLGWADRAVGALRAAASAKEAERARAVPARHADIEALVARARPAALSQEPAMVAMALDLLQEALIRDPAHSRALALAGWARSVGANHLFTQDPDGERMRAAAHCEQALALAPGEPEVLTLVAGALSMARCLDRAEELVARSLALDPSQPEALRRLGFIQNFRGDGHRAVAAFPRSLRLYPAGHNGPMSLIGLGIAQFILGEYERSARSLALALDQQPARAWPHRFPTAAAMHAGSREEAQRSLASLRRSFPDLTVGLCSHSVALHPDAKGRVLDGLARAGLPH
ncbi:tetratricopeptide repeat protein [Sabulicella glaciei]|uniref:Tetratricopeptide repeat protein n=1 Tax=Sabulicella glaciei TaxID=2984948 RepID=A0ABT3P225_9PROT|nr:hypothetical protein [Roseococcus sp. MDT2-1-1]MCW8088465.1 hypothetical protein [Roseococcus sp. MDT2-1-1]